MAISERLTKLLKKEGIAFEHTTHPEAYTMQEVAAVEHERGRCLVKAVVVKADEGFILAGVPASSKVDLDALGKLVGAKETRLAEEHEFADLFPDCDVGAMPPIGNLYDLPLWLDTSFDTCDYVVFNAGTHTDTVKMSLEDFKKLASPQSGQITVTN